MHASTTTPNAFFRNRSKPFSVNSWFASRFWYCQNVTPPYGGVGDGKSMLVHVGLSVFHTSIPVQQFLHCPPSFLARKSKTYVLNRRRLHDNVRHEFGGAGGAYPMASFHWLWENEVAPLDPMDADVLSAYFPGRGLVVLRTGWDVSDVMFSIEAGPYYDVIHNQADKGRFTFYGLGGRWAIDSGYGNMGPSAPTGRDQTIAHNSMWSWTGGRL